MSLGVFFLILKYAFQETALRACGGQSARARSAPCWLSAGHRGGGGGGGAPEDSRCPQQAGNPHKLSATSWCLKLKVIQEPAQPGDMSRKCAETENVCLWKTNPERFL